MNYSTTPYDEFLAFWLLNVSVDEANRRFLVFSKAELQFFKKLLAGFASMQSLRASLPSVSMHRISEQQVKSSKSSIINTELSTTKEKLVELVRSSQQQQQHQNIISMYTNSTNMQENFSFGKVTKQEFMHSEDNDMMVNQSISSMNHRTEVCSVQSDDSVFTSKITSSNNEEPPALPVKTRTRTRTRKERHISQYDNVEELDSFSRYIELSSWNIIMRNDGRLTIYTHRIFYLF